MTGFLAQGKGSRPADTPKVHRKLTFVAIDDFLDHLNLLIPD
jgi:hypothetical protein